MKTREEKQEFYLLILPKTRREDLVNSIKNQLEELLDSDIYIVIDSKSESGLFCINPNTTKNYSELSEFIKTDFI